MRTVRVDRETPKGRGKGKGKGREQGRGKGSESGTGSKRKRPGERGVPRLAIVRVGYGKPGETDLMIAGSRVVPFLSP